jgi:pyruvate formate lyase activating enzyme
MIVAGLQKLSLVDFPGKLASVIFLQGCNFRCGYCQNPELIPREGVSGVSVEEVLGYLSCRKNNIEGVVVTGGEPTVHDDLALLLEKIAAIGLEIKLDTNGSDPKILGGLISSGLLSYIAVDIKTSFSKYNLVSSNDNISDAVMESVRICMDSGVPYEFRTTCVPGVLEKTDIIKIGEAVKGARRYCLQQFRPKITFDEAFTNVKPFSPDTVRSFAEDLSGYVEKVDVRGL